MWIRQRREQSFGVRETEFYGECLVTETEQVPERLVERHRPQITQITQKLELKRREQPRFQQKRDVGMMSVPPAVAGG